MILHHKLDGWLVRNWLSGIVVFWMKYCIIADEKLLVQDFMAGKLEQYPGERPTKNDWMNHLGNIYPEVYSYFN